MQMVDAPTCGKNTLDLIFSNSEELVTDSKVIVNKKISDHNSVIFNLGLKNNNDLRPNPIDEDIQSFNAFDFVNASAEAWIKTKHDFANVNWELELEDKSSEESLELFMSKIKTTSENNFSKKGDIKTKKSFKNNNKIPKGVRNLFRQKMKLSKKALEADNPKIILNAQSEIAEIDNKLKASYAKWNLAKEQKVVENLKIDPKSFYKYANSKSNVRTGIGPLEKSKDTYTNDPSEMASLLNKQYSSVFSKPDPALQVENTSSFFSKEPEVGFLSDLVITEELVEKAIGDLKLGSAGGPDGLPALWLKNMCDSIKLPLSIILKKSLQEHIFPSQLKHAHVIPVYKGKSRSCPANYRPVSLTNVIGKVFERVARDQITNHLEESNIFNENQHGFRQNRSCLSQLLSHYDSAIHMAEKHGNLDVLYLDFSKAFDKVDHGLVHQKLLDAKITGNIAKWIISFLKNRSQRVRIGNTLSEPLDVISGVPQGTVLGPLIFLLVINNIDFDLNKEVANATLFADDTRVAGGVSEEEDVEMFQDEINKIYRWQASNNMRFNSDKFELLRFGNNIELKESTSYFSPDMADIIEEKDSLRDLGITMNNKLTFRDHIDGISHKLKMKSSWLLRSFRCRDLKFMKTVWKSLALPIVDYCSPLWFSPEKPGDISGLEDLQRSFFRQVSGLEELSYWDRLKKMKMYSIQRCLERYMVIYI